MKSLSGVGVGLSIVFGCLVLALLAELYYLLWWKKRWTSREMENDYSNPTRKFFYMFCWKRSSSSSSSSSSSMNPQEIRISSEDDPKFKSNNFVHHEVSNGMEVNSISGPPRFLFTIVEETKEDLESEETKSNNKSRVGSRERSLSDLMLSVETPYLTPLASPPFFTPPLTPMESAASSAASAAGCNQLGFNPLFESATDAEFNRLRSSPPPKFKFLQEAEEKLCRKMEMEAIEESGGDMTPPSKYLKDEDQDGSFITIVVDRSKEREFNQIHYHQQQQQQQFHSSTSQVLPLSSSPSTFKSPSQE